MSYSLAKALKTIGSGKGLRPHVPKSGARVREYVSVSPYTSSGRFYNRRWSDYEPMGKVESAVSGKTFWFEPSTKHFFKSRIAQTGIRRGYDVYFTSSEKGPNGIRLYSTNKTNLKSGETGHVGEFQAYKTAAAARAALKRATGRQ
jgi:hypothetical protein